MRIILLLALCLASCSPQVSENENRASSLFQRQPAFQVIVPKETWEPIYFKEIDERAGIANLASLRVAALPKDDLETRIWIGFGLTALRGFDVKRLAGQWEGTYIDGIYPRLARKDYQRRLQPPKSGWEEFWQRLVTKGILTLPDARSIGCEGDAVDGMSYVVENSINNIYRTYMYDNPQFAKCGEAKQILEILDILEDEFGPQLPRY